jgi:hypothetical protein
MKERRGGNMEIYSATREVAKQKASNLFAEIRKICSTNQAREVDVGWDGTNCTITDGLVSLTVEVDVLSRVHILGEPISGFQFERMALSKACFVPDFPSGCNFGWREKGRTAKPFLSVAELAEWCVSQFIALERRNENGQIKHEWRGNAHPPRSSL